MTEERLTLNTKDTRYLREVILKVRNVYIDNPYIGLCTWFDEFDHHASHGDIQLCEKLLKEIQTQDYPLSYQNKNYITNREGNLWLIKGIKAHKERNYAEAEKSYLRSLEIQKQVRCKACQGQVLEALNLLGKELKTGKQDPYLIEIGRKMTRFHASELLLCDGMVSGCIEDHEQIIRAAVQRRLNKPLIIAMKSHTHDHIRMKASAALGRFNCVLDSNILLEGLNDSHWFVRWRVTVILGQIEKLAKHSVPKICHALTQEVDPEVILCMVIALGNLGDSSATSVLMECLDDSDDDVCEAAIKALENIGTRAALVKLERLIDDEELISHHLIKLAQKTIKAIKKRYPIIRVEMFGTYKLTSPENELKPETSFFDHETIICIANIYGIDANARLRLHCTKFDGATVFEQESLYRELQNQAENSSLPLPNSLVEVVNSEPQHGTVSQTDEENVHEIITNDFIDPGSIIFKISPSGAKKLLPGIYSVTLYIFDNAIMVYEPQANCSIEIVSP